MNGFALTALAIGGIGTTELLVILGILILLFGASRIPELGKSLGSGIRGFQKSIRGDDDPRQIEQSPPAPSNTATSDSAQNASKAP